MATASCHNGSIRIQPYRHDVGSGERGKKLITEIWSVKNCKTKVRVRGTLSFQIWRVLGSIFAERNFFL